MTPSFEELKSMSEDDLIKRIDHQLFSPLPSQLDILVGQIYRDVWVRTAQDKATQAMLGYTEKMHDLTRRMTSMTIIITIFTFFNLITTVILLFKKP